MKVLAAAPLRLPARVLVLLLAGGIAGLLYVTVLGLTATAPRLTRAGAMAAVTFILLTIVFSALERVSPEQGRKLRHWGAERRTDVLWWFASYGSRFAAGAATTGCIVIVTRMLPTHAGAPVSTQPVWLQVPEALLIGDFLQCWIHRLLHRPVLWSLHAVHHSPEDLNWLSTTRIHPIETVLKGPVEMVPLYFLGFSPVATLPLVTVLLGLYEIFLHANVGWRFGPLRFVIASPGFHRWHHTAETEGFDKDFAGLFPLYDLAFGTFHMPDRVSSAYGLGQGQQMSSSFWQQLAHPVRTACQAPTRHWPKDLASYPRDPGGRCRRASD